MSARAATAGSTLVLVPSVLERQGLLGRGTGLPELHCCGVGPVESALGSASLLAAIRPARVLLVGIAGTRDPERAPLGALVVGTAAVNEAVGAGHGAGFVGLCELDLPDDVAPDTIALSPPVGLHPDRAARLLPGALGTVAAASGTASEAAGWSARHPHVLAEDMESWAVAVACLRAGTPLSVLRSISNIAGQRDPAVWLIDESLAALAAALEDLS